MLIPWFRKKEVAATQDTVVDNQEPVDVMEEQDENEEEDDWEEEEDEREEIQERVYSWGQEWSQTPEFEALPTELKDESEYIIESFTEYMYSYQGVTPEAWNVTDMEECLLSTLPRKISAEEIYFRALSPVLASFFTFLGKTRRLRNASRMAQRVLALGPSIVAASNNPRNWGMAKSFAMAAMADGVDLANKKQMDAFMVRYNARMMGQALPLPEMTDLELPPDDFEPETIPYVREGPKVGRNDPCPCGSGKKYKKCCGSA